MRFKNLSFFLFFLIPLVRGFSQVPSSKVKFNYSGKLREGEWILKISDQSSGKFFLTDLTIKYPKNCPGDIYSLIQNGDSVEMRSFWESDHLVYISLNHDVLDYLSGYLNKISNNFLKGTVRSDSGKEFQAELSFERENSKNLKVDELLVSFYLFPINEDGEDLFPDFTRLIKADLVTDLNSSKFYICYAPLPPKRPQGYIYFDKYYLYKRNLDTRIDLIAIPLVDRTGIFRSVFPFDGIFRANSDQSAFWILDDTNQAGIYFQKMAF